MTWVQALILGALQGATEFLPISSSGHLVLFPWLLGWDIDPEVLFPFAVVLHWGTLLAVIAAFWSDLVRLISAALQGIRRRDPLGSVDAKLAWLLIIATIPAALAGMLFSDLIRGAFAQPQVVALLLIINGGLLMLGEWFRTRRSSASALSEFKLPDAIVIGLFQVLALLPGISRSGSTIGGPDHARRGNRCSWRFQHDFIRLRARIRNRVYRRGGGRICSHPLAASISFARLTARICCLLRGAGPGRYGGSDNPCIKRQ